MASPASSAFFEGTTSPNSPHTIDAHGGIATITYADGTTVQYHPRHSIAGSSPFTSSPAVFSRSVSHRRGRDRGGSCATDLSSTASAQDFFKKLHVGSSQPLEIPSNVQPPSSHPQAPWTSEVISSGTPVFQEHVAFGEDWTATLGDRSDVRPQDFGEDIAMDWMNESQDHFVSNAEGSGQELFPFEDDVTLNDLSGEQLQPFPPLDTRPSSFIAPQLGQASDFSASAPPATGYMHHARRRRPTFTGILHHHFEEESPADIETVTSNTARRTPGRTRGMKLPEDSRKNAATMRIMGSCRYCKSGRRKCDPGTPCRQCINHFGPDVLDDATRCCRQDDPLSLVERLITQILDVKWHPHPREHMHFFGRDCYVTEWCFIIPIRFPFGPPLERAVQVVQTSDLSLLRHQHVNYPQLSPQGAGSPTTSVDHMLPVTFSRTDDLLRVFDGHLDVLVMNHFHSIAMPGSDLQILDKIHKLYVHYRQVNQEYGTLLQQALKLLLLPHLSLPTVSTADPVISHILQKLSPSYCLSQTVTPCLLRAELAAVLPQLARVLLQDVLKKVLRITLGKKCETHPIVLAVSAVLMMFIESTSHAASLLGYHAHTRLPSASSSLGNSFSTIISPTSTFHSTASSLETGPGLTQNATAAWQLLRLYRTCFESCHRSVILVDSSNGNNSRNNSLCAARAHARTNSVGSSATATERGRAGSTNAAEKHFSKLVREVGSCAASFLAQVGSEVKSRREWLEEKACAGVGTGEKNEDEAGAGLGWRLGMRVEEDGGVVFDRYVARLLVLWKADGDV